jgi:hypothetical protein
LQLIIYTCSVLIAHSCAPFLTTPTTLRKDDMDRDHNEEGQISKNIRGGQRGQGRRKGRRRSGARAGQGNSEPSLSATADGDGDQAPSDGEGREQHAIVAACSVVTNLKEEFSILDINENEDGGLTGSGRDRTRRIADQARRRPGYSDGPLPTYSENLSFLSVPE